ncbi:DUF3103 family protein [Kitasatospora sp. NPDC004531]
MFSLHSARRLRTVVTGLTLTGLAVTTAQGFASAAPVPAAQHGSAHVSAVDSIEDGAARSLALSFGDKAWQRQVSGALAQGKAVGLRGLTAGSTTSGAHGLGASVATADRKVADAKGLGTDVGPLLQVRLVGAAVDGVEPLVASSPSDDDATVVVAYDSAGKAYRLAADHAPDRPVILVDVDTDKATEAGMKVVQQELAAAGLQAPTTAPVNSAAAATGFWTSRVTAVSVGDVKEPWFKGDAEIFDLVTGFGLDGKVRVDTVTMPYLDDENKTYYPNQILVNWSLYKYNLADVVMMEDDGNTNYSSLAKALAAVLLTITDQGAYIPLVNAIIDAMPASWWTDDPDYVDSWYTLATTTTGTRTGASGNGKMTFDRYWVSAL